MAPRDEQEVEPREPGSSASRPDAGVRRPRLGWRLRRASKRTAKRRSLRRMGWSDERIKHDVEPLG